MSRDEHGWFVCLPPGSDRPGHRSVYMWTLANIWPLSEFNYSRPYTVTRSGAISSHIICPVDRPGRMTPTLTPVLDQGLGFGSVLHCTQSVS